MKAPGNPLPPNAGKGRPKGSKNKQGKEVRDLARTHTAEALRVIVGLMRGKTPRGKSIHVEPSTQLMAASELLSRAWGRPATAITGDGGKGPAQVHITVIDELYPNG